MSYGDYGAITPTVSSGDVGAMIAGVFATVGIIILVVLAIVILVMVAKYKLFKKMGIEGWKSLIPMVTDYLQMEATGVSQKWLLIVTFGGVVTLIPIIGYLVYLVAIIYMGILVNVSLAKAFGKSTGFAVGLILLNPIFLCILAFSKDSKYIGKNPMNDVIFGGNKTNTVNNTNTVAQNDVQEAQVSEDNQSRFCPNCGAKMEGDSKFCASCGKEI